MHPQTRLVSYADNPDKELPNAHMLINQYLLPLHNPRLAIGQQPQELDTLDLRILDSRDGTPKLLGKAE